jgi:hypothetical protein
MEDWVDYLFPASLLITTVIVWVVVIRRKEVHVPLVIYAGSYFVTTVIGAAIIGIFGTEYLEDLGWELDTAPLRDISSPLYWGLLFAPLIIVPVVHALLNEWYRSRLSHRRRTPVRPLSLIAYCLLVVVGTGYCFTLFENNGYLNILGNIADYSGNYAKMISLRTEMMEGLGNSFYGLIYVSLPALSHCALYEAVNRNGVVWRLLFVITLLVTAALSVAIIQKALLLVYLIAVTVGLLHLGVIRRRMLLLAAVGGFVLLTLMTSVFVEDWQFGQSFDLLIFRGASSFPYYVTLYPEQLPHPGPDFGLHIFGIGDSPRDNLDVFERMYPSIWWMQGAASGPAHVRAFAQAGFGFSIFVVALIGVAVNLVDRLRQRISGPISFSIYIQAVVGLYYLTQVSLLDSLFTSYGLYWAAFILVPLWLLNRVLLVKAPAPAANEMTSETEGSLS